MSVVEISSIVGDDNLMHWLNLDPKIYYKNSEAYGVIGTLENSGWTYVAASVKNHRDDFTQKMLVDVARMIKTKSVCIITDVIEAQPKMRETLKRFGNFSFEYDEDGVMFSFKKL